MEQFKKSIAELGLATTAYGLPNLIRAKRTVTKLFWIIFLIVSSSFSGYFVYQSILTYNAYRVVTVIQSVYEQPAQFPTISFCSIKFGSFDFDPLIELIKPNKCEFEYDYNCSKSPTNYFERFESWYGTCFRFNSGKNITGHSIPILNSNIGGKDDHFELSIYAPEGLEIWIHNYTSPPKIEYLSNHYGDGLFVPAGAKSLIVLDKVSDVKLAKPYNDCFDDVSEFPLNKTIINYILNQNESYRHSYCLEICFDLEYINDNPCNCTKASLGKVWSNCWATEERYNIEGCTYLYKEEFFKQSILDKCSKYCPKSCETVSFSASVSFYNTKDYNFTTISVYYRSLNFLSIKQEPKMDIVDLISNIGGVFGLFVGLSFVSLFEIVELLIEVFHVLIESKFWKIILKL